MWAAARTVKTPKMKTDMMKATWTIKEAPTVTPATEEVTDLATGEIAKEPPTTPLH